MEIMVKCIECGEEFKIVIHCEEGYIEFPDGGCCTPPRSGLPGVSDFCCDSCDSR